MSDDHLSGERVAILLGLTTRQVQRLAREGAILRDGRRGFTVASVAAAIARRHGRADGEKRIADARAAEIELRIAARRRELIPYEEAVAALDDVVGAVREEASGLPARITRDLALRRKIEQEVDGFLGRLSNRLSKAAAALEAGSAALESAPKAPRPA